MTPGMALTGDLKSGKYNKMPESDDPFALDKWMLKKMKKVVIMCVGSAAMKF